MIATNDAYRFMAEQQAKEIGMEIDILVEPSRRDLGAGHGRRCGLCRATRAPRRCWRWRRTIW